MKVYLGPFTSWIGPYQIADLLQYVGVGEDKCHDIGTWLAGGPEKDSWLMRVCTWVEQHRHREVRVRIDRYDTWNMDGTLAILILPMLKQLRDTKHGSPSGMPAFGQTSNSAQFCFAFYEEGDRLADLTGHQQWKDILEEMIWTFEQLQPDYDWEDQYWLVRPEIDFTDYPEDIEQACHPVRWKVEGKCDWDGRAAHAARIQHGLETFGRHFHDLWD